MCGICGVVGAASQRADALESVRRMNALLLHRGPDDSGLWEARGAILAARRLSIIDPPGGHQPMVTEDSRFAVAFNGEIYNAAELRDTLESRGHVFRTQCDTEVVLRGTAEFGDDLARRMNGMFAYAAWDGELRRATLVRDRFGQKPLYYGVAGQDLWFSSELKSLRAAWPGSETIDPQAVSDYLTLQYVPDPASVFREIRRVPAGHLLIFERGQARLQRYWSRRAVLSGGVSWREARDEVRRLTLRAVRRHCVSDVPYGAFLSGGLDSAVLVAAMAQQGLDTRTFTLGFSERAHDERSAARAVAQRWGTEHHEFVFGAGTKDMEGCLERVVETFHEPFADASAVQTLELARKTARHVKVVLSGDGGDEVFAGYPRYWLDRWAGWYRRVPGAVRRRLVAPVLERLREPESVAIEANWRLGAKRLVQFAETDRGASIVAWGSFFDETAKARLGLGGALGGEFEPTASRLAATYDASAGSHLERTIAVDRLWYLAGDILTKTDRSTMAHSLEARSPFLDHELCEFVDSLPARCKVRGFSGKWVLRRAFQDDLPPATTRGPKRGFGLPIEQWLRDRWAQPSRSFLCDQGSQLSALMSVDEVGRLLAEHQSRQADHGRRIWSLLCLEAWLRWARPAGRPAR